MIYAIHAVTKQHFAINPSNHKWEGPVDECRLQHADTDGWIPWKGGECPLPNGAMYEISTHGCRVSRGRLPELLDWSRPSRMGDILAYRPILDAADPEPLEWGGEGLPPAGTAFEFSASNGRAWEERIMLFNDGVTCLMAHRQFPMNRWHYKCEDPDIVSRPLRTPAQRAEDALAAQLLDAVNKDGGDFCHLEKPIAKHLYAAIRDGKVPGVKLEGDA